MISIRDAIKKILSSLKLYCERGHIVRIWWLLQKSYYHLNTVL